MHVKTCLPKSQRRPDDAYGEIAGPIDPNLYDKITREQEPITERPGLLVPSAIKRLRESRGPFQSDDDLLLAAFYNDGQYSALKAAGLICTDYPLGETPLLTLIKGIAVRPDITSFHYFEKTVGTRDEQR